MKSKIVRTPLLLSFTIAALLVASVPYAQNAPATQGRGPSAGRGMMAQQQQMMAEMKAAQTRLDALVVSMNAANGAEKVDRLAAVVTEMAAQHKAMSQRMMSMHDGMMAEMMRQMHGAGAAPAATPQNGSPEDHSAHHPAEK